MAINKKLRYEIEAKIQEVNKQASIEKNFSQDRAFCKIPTRYVEIPEGTVKIEGIWPNDHCGQDTVPRVWFYLNEKRIAFNVLWKLI